MVLGRKIGMGEAWGLGMAMLAFALTVLLAAPLRATAEQTVATRGSGAGEVERPRGIAVDRSDGLLYVADSGSNRIDVFDADSGEFLRAFGWGVDTGAAELETCTTISGCQKGLAGSGTGQLSGPVGVAVDNDSTSAGFQDIYVYDGANFRVQRFSPEGDFVSMFGGGVVSGGASGTGDLTSGSKVVSFLTATNKQFVVGQTVSGVGIAAGTTVTAVGNGAAATMTLSKPAEATASGVTLTAPEGAGNVPANEEQTVALSSLPTGGTFTLTLPARQGFDAGTTAAIAFDAPSTGAGSVRQALEALPGVGAGDVEVSGSAGGPWTVEFKGTLADTDIGQLTGDGSALTPSGTETVTIATVQSGAEAAEVCSVPEGCQVGKTGSGEGQFQEIRGLAVGPSGEVHVIDTANTGSCEVPGIGGDSKFTKRLQKFTPAGTLAEPAISLTEPPCGNVNAFAVDSSGNFYLGNNGASGAVHKYQPDGTPFGAPYPINQSYNIRAIAVDEAGNLFVADNTSVPHVREYDSVGTQLRTFYGSLVRGPEGVAPYEGSNGDLFVTEEFLSAGELGGALRHIDFPPAGPVVYPRESTITGLSNVKATFNAQINPEGKETEYFFEYITDEDFVAAGNSFGAGTEKTAETVLSGAADFVLHAASANVTGLIPETVYHVRAVAVNADGGPNQGPEASFETKPPIEFGDVWSSEVGTEGASLHAEVNPVGIAATGRFQYVDQATYEASGFTAAIEVPGSGEDPIDFGEGEEMKDGSAPLSGLQPDTTYRYRITATDRCKPEPEPLCEFVGPEGSFTTFGPSETPEPCANDELRQGAGAWLPDCRAYEMVSPVEKSGANVEAVEMATGFPASLDQAAADGESITYTTYKAFGEVQSAPYVNQYLTRRGSAEWATEAISPSREGPSLMTFGSAQLDRQYKAFSEDLCYGWVVQDARPTLAAGAPEDYPGLYRRDNCGIGAGSYEALTTVEPPNLPPSKFVPELQGVSADGSVAVFSVTDNLTGGTASQPSSCVAEAESCEARLYEAREGQLQPICVLPSGTPSSGDCGAGTAGSFGWYERGGSIINALSADGSRVFWSTELDFPGSLYVRLNGAETTEISSTYAWFWTAAADGSLAVYTAGTAVSPEGSLFAYDVEAEEAMMIADEVLGVAGASEDASQIYFASTSVLSGEEENSEGDKAEAGKANLYLHEEGEGVRFVAALATDDDGSFASRPAARLSRVTPDGEQLVFMSRGSLTGYDNTDAASKEADQEVFLYNSTAEGGQGELHCVSCNPTGARPQGRQLTQKLLEGTWAAARIPTWQSQLYGSRVISDDGSRLYFNSFEALVPRDSNDAEDVYQWEAPGSGTCTTARATFRASAGGCVDLVSSGESPQGSELLDIGVDGNDVFFKTYSKLVGQDDDGLLDIYDARVGGGLAGQWPAAEEEPCDPEVEGECQPDAEPPAADPTPPSSLAGPGNPTYKECPKGKRVAIRNGREVCVAKSCPKGKRRVKRNGKVRCVKPQKRRSANHKRSAGRGRAAR